MSDHQKALLALAKDRPLAHKILFKHRHSLESAGFHREMIVDFHSFEQQVVIEAARGFGKSTTGEEATTVKAEFTDFANGVIVSSTQARAAERLEAIKHEIENNDAIVELFGAQTGNIWQAHKAVLANGVCLQALGVGQAVRGIKHHEFRPDFLWIDDIEDEESVKTPEACQERLRWLYGTLLPVCAKEAVIRVTGNRLSPDAVVSKLASNPQWASRRYPISHTDVESGREVATWPAFRDMVWIEEKRREYFDLGLASTWSSEYMCESQSEAVKPFKAEDYRVSPRVRTWQGVFAIWDPAKTAKNLRQQAHYGKAVFSWVQNKLIVWDGGAKPLMPSEMISDIFAVEKEYSCVSLDVEADGLEDWLMEPLRLEQQKRRILLPHLRAIRAPKDKDGFIRALQPLAMSGQIEFAQDLPEFRSQMLNFPSGRKDALNALAYAQKVRPGQLIYEAFTEENIVEELEANLRSTPFLCVNADGTQVTAVMAQYDGTLAIIADWIESGDPGTCLEAILKQASLYAGKFNLIVPPKEYDPYENKGVVAAARRIPKKVSVGQSPDLGKAEIRDLLGRRSQFPLVRISSNATWTLRAFAGGYHKVFVKGVEGEAEQGPYRTLMEALESFSGIMRTSDVEESEGLYRETKHGQTYRSLVGARR